MNWQDNIIQTREQIKDLLANVKTIAVLGIKTEEQSYQPAFYVPEYMSRAGFEVIPVPVYYPEAETILDRKVYRNLIDIPEEIDLVNVFRRPNDLPKHTAYIIAARPKAVWFQSGIRHDEVAKELAEAGIKVVQDKCLMVEHRNLR